MSGHRSSKTWPSRTKTRVLGRDVWSVAFYNRELRRLYNKLDQLPMNIRKLDYGPRQSGRAFPHQ